MGGSANGPAPWLLDHVLLSAHALDRSIDFYELVLDAKATQFEISPSKDSAASTTSFAHFMGRDGTSLHIATPTPNFHVLYPELRIDHTRPHVAMTVDDLRGRMARLEALGWRMQPPKAWGPTGYWRLYTDEPGTSLIELNQQVGEGPSAEPGAWRLDHVAIPAYDLEDSSSWFSDALGAPVVDGVVTDAHGHRLALRIADPGRRHDPTRHLGLAVPDVAAVAGRLEAAGIAFDSGVDGDGLEVTDPSGNVVHVVADAPAG